MRMAKPGRLQRGAILIVSLIMLMVLSLLAVSAIRMSTTELRSINSTQARLEALSAAQRAIEQILNSNFAANIGGVANTYSISVDAGQSYAVQVDAPCLKHRETILNSELDLTNSEDAKCYAGGTVWSDCARTTWELRAAVNQGLFGVNVQVKQGVGIRMDNASALAYSTNATYLCS